MAKHSGLPKRKRNGEALAALRRASRREGRLQLEALNSAREVSERMEALVSAFAELLRNPEFVRLAQAEGIDTIPAPLAKRLARRSDS